MELKFADGSEEVTAGRSEELSTRGVGKLFGDESGGFPIGGSWPIRCKLRR